MSSFKPPPPPSSLHLVEEQHETMDDDGGQLFSPETDEFLRLERSMMEAGVEDEESRKRVLHNELQVSERVCLCE